MSAESNTPEAVLRPERRASLTWIIPIAALLLAGGLAFAAWKQRGLRVTVHLPDGHGLKIGDPARYRGINVGAVTDVALSDDLDGVTVTVSLVAKADRLARAGARFWIVRPRLRLTGVEGLETLIGPRYIAVEPAADAETAARQREFLGLPDAPVVPIIAPGDLEIVLDARARGSLRPGAPVTYRNVRVGTVLSVGLASDGSRVEGRAHIAKEYRQLIRQGTKFWDAGGVRANIGLTGLSLEIDSLEDVVTGGVALATPPSGDAGEAAQTGHRYWLYERAEDDWSEWEPTVAVGSSLLPADSVRPQPLRATIAWKQGLIMKGSRSRQGWVLQTTAGLLGPADLLTPDPGRRTDLDTVSLEVAGRVVALDEESIRSEGGLARLAVRVGRTDWPDRLTRRPEKPEDCIAIADPVAQPLPLSASRLTPGDGGWIVDPAVSADETWHGASVLSRVDGKLVGLLLVEGEQVRVAFIPAS